MSHFKKVCICGIVIAQCRCIDSDKSIQIIYNCDHVENKVKDEVDREDDNFGNS